MKRKNKGIAQLPSVLVWIFVNLVQVEIWSDSLLSSLRGGLLGDDSLSISSDLLLVGSSDHIRGDVLVVLEEGLSSEGSAEDTDWIESEAWSDLNKLDLLALGVILNDLVVSEPDAIVANGEGEDVIDEGLALWMVVGGSESLNEDLLEELPFSGGLELTIERQQWARSQQTVSSHSQLIHSVDVLGVEFDGGSLWGLGKPDIEILLLSGLEVDGGVAVLKVGDLVQVLDAILGVELGLLLGMGQELLQILLQMSESGDGSARGDEEGALLVAELWNVGVGIGDGIGVGWASINQQGLGLGLNRSLLVGNDSLVVEILGDLGLDGGIERGDGILTELRDDGRGVLWALVDLGDLSLES